MNRILRNRIGRAAAAWLICATLAASAWATPEPLRLLADSDAIRNPARPFSVTVTLTEYQGGTQVETSVLTSYSRQLDAGGQFASLIWFVKPARDAGKVMMKRGDDLWFYDPGTKASIRISPQQRLLGQASNGDVVTVNFAKDYDAALVSTDEIQDGERQRRRAYQLELKARTDEATYAAITLWVDALDHRPLKAQFFADSGRVLKTAYYRRFQPQLGAERPTETVIIDGVNPRSVTVLRMSNYTARDIPATWFTRDYLPRFQPE